MGIFRRCTVQGSSLSVYGKGQINCECFYYWQYVLVANPFQPPLSQCIQWCRGRRKGGMALSCFAKKPPLNRTLWREGHKTPVQQVSDWYPVGILHREQLWGGGGGGGGVQIAAVNVVKFNRHFTAVVLAVCRCCWCKCWLGVVYVQAKKFVESAAGVVVGVSVGWVLCMCRPRSLWRAPPRWWRQTCPKMKLRSWKRNWLLLEAQQRLSDMWLLLFHKGTECKPVCRRNGPPMHLPHFVDFKILFFWLPQWY